MRKLIAMCAVLAAAACATTRAAGPQPSREPLVRPSRLREVSFAADFPYPGGESFPNATPLLDADGQARFHVAIIPLHAVEGGIVGFELVVVHSRDDQENLLGERSSFSEECRCYPEGPFDIDIAYVHEGVLKSRFGDVRTLPLPDHAGTLTWTIVDFASGQGVGSCPTCSNFKSIHTRVDIKPAP